MDHPCRRQKLDNAILRSPAISARELHEGLQVVTPFKKWIDRMCEYGFENAKDFWTKMSESIGGRLYIGGYH